MRRTGSRRCRCGHLAVIVVLIGTLSLPVLASGQDIGPGLYKDGKKLIPLEEMIDPSQPRLSDFPRIATSDEPALREMLLGDRRPSDPAPRHWVRTVLACRDAVISAGSSDHSDEAGVDAVAILLDLESDLLSADQAMTAHLELVEAELKDRGLPEDKLDRHRTVIERHRQTADELLGLLTDLRAQSFAGDIAGPLSRLKDYFERHIFEPEPQSYSNAHPLPVQPHVLQAPVLQKDEIPPTRDSRRSIATGAKGYDPADLLETPDIQFTQEIQDLAAALDNSPVRMYNYVRENFEFEPYLGSRKGAQQTLDHKGGNDYDQASLLIALLRVSGLPARYARGTIEMPIDRAKNWLGIQDAANAASILATAGMGGTLMLMGSDTVAIRCQRVWVEAYIPFANYRGAINDSTGKMWVTIDPVFKQYEYDYGINLPAEIGFDAEGFVQDYYSSFHAETPVDVFRQMLLDSLAVRYPGATYEDLITSREVIRETDGILPGTLPFELVSFDTRFSEIPADKRYGIQFHVYGSGTDMTYSTTLPEIAGKQVTISYVGATAADQQIIDDAGGIFNVTEPYLVDLQPILRIDGCEVARGTGAVMMGRTHNSDMHFTAPTGASNQMPTVSNYITAGNYQGIGIDPEDALPAASDDPATSCDESTLGWEQHQLALSYLHKVDLGGDEAADLMHQVVMNDVSEAIVENSVTVWLDGYGDPLSLDWTGMIVDADRKIIGPFSVYGADVACDYMRLSGADGSIQENKLFEDRFDEEAISAVKILELASDSGIAVCEITTSIAADCPGFSHSTTVTSAVNAALAQGHHVIIPEREFTYYEWTGTGYIDIDPVTCAAGYIISGGQNGGATVQTWGIPWYLWFSGIVCTKATGPVTVSPAATGDMYCANSWDFWTFHVPDIDYYAKNQDDQCYIKHSAGRDFQVWFPIRVIAWIWGPGEYVFRAGSLPPSDCAGCGYVEKTVTIVEVEFPQGDFVVARDKDRTMSVTVTPAGAPVTFESGATGVATVSGGGSSLNVHGVSAGEANLRAMLNGSECESKKVYVGELSLTLGSNSVCDGSDVAVTVTVQPSNLPNLRNVTFESNTTVTSLGNPIGHTNLAFDPYNASTHQSRIQNAIWYSTQADHCNDFSSYEINVKADVGGTTLESSNQPVLTVDASGTCNNGAASPTQFFSGQPAVTVTHNSGTGQWEAIVQAGTFIRNVRATHNNITNVNSQYWQMIENEEVFHVGQLEGTSSNIVSDLWDPAAVLAASAGPHVAATQNTARALAQAAFNRALNAEMTRSNTIAFQYPPGANGRRCNIESEAKNAAGATHHGTMTCSYTACP